MLYKNNERYLLSAKEIAHVKSLLNGKDKAQIVFPKNFYYETRDDKGEVRRVSKQMGIIPFEELIPSFDEKDGGSYVNWKYTKNAPTKNKEGELEFYRNCDPCLRFRGLETISDIELLYFLLKISTCGTHSKNRVQPPVFEIVNTAMQAKNAIEEERKHTAISSAIVGEFAISEADLLRVAAAFSLDINQDMTDDEKRALVLTAVRNREKSHHDGYSLFSDVINATQRNQVLLIVSEAKKMNLIEYNSKDSKWILLDEKGVRITDLCKIDRAKDSEQELIRMCLNDTEVSKKLIIHVDNYKEIKQD